MACFSGTTTGATWSYYDCCGALQTGTTFDTPICYDDESAFSGIVTGATVCFCECQCVEIDIDNELFVFTDDGYYFVSLERNVHINQIIF
jgi:hypothetical protein